MATTNARLLCFFLWYIYVACLILRVLTKFRRFYQIIITVIKVQTGKHNKWKKYTIAQ